MKKMPLVSVIIPMYNAEKYIQETLTSLKNQSYENYEVIIVDNASTDNSVSVAQKMSFCFKSFRIVKSEVNSGGPAQPRNIGVNKASGEFIAFLDSDDLWHKDKLFNQIKLMIEKDYNFTCTSRILVDEYSNQFERIVDKILPGKTGSYSILSLIRRNNITTSSVVVKHQLLVDFPFDESNAVACVEDYLLWLNLLNLNQCNFHHLKEPLVYYRLFKQSLSQQDGRFLLLAKSMLASCLFMVKNKRTDLLLPSLVSHTVRVLLLRF